MQCSDRVVLVFGDESSWCDVRNRRDVKLSVLAAVVDQWSLRDGLANVEARIRLSCEHSRGQVYAITLHLTSPRPPPGLFSVCSTVSLVSHVPLTCKTFGVDCSSCRAATTMTLTYSCPSLSKLYPHSGRLLIVFLSLPVLTVIVSPLWGSIACFVVISSRFRRCRV